MLTKRGLAALALAATATLVGVSNLTGRKRRAKDKQ